MNDDWRLKIDLHEDGLAHQLGETLGAEQVEHDLERTFHDRVVVSVDGSEVFCYTGTREQAGRAEQLIRQVAGEHGWKIDVELTHWHAEAELWESPDAETGDYIEEREERVESEREESAAQGYPDLEVRIQCKSHHDASQLSARLKAEDMPHVHRWTYILVGATDEDSAQALAERLRGESPSGAVVTVEANRRAIYDNRLWSPFSVLGGLGG